MNEPPAPDPSADAPSRARAWARVIVFAAFTLAPAVGFVASGGEASVSGENRDPAPAPRLPTDAQSWTAFPRAVTAWWKDRMGFRTELVQMNARVRYRHFGTVPSKDLIVGDGGWLFYRPSVDSGSVGAAVDSSVLKAWTHEVAERSAALRGRGVAYLFLVAPNKETIHPERLPQWARESRSPHPRTDEWIASLTAEERSLVVDPRSLLRAAAASEQVYSSLDTHWNDLGASIVAAAVVDRLRAAVPPVPAVAASFVRDATAKTCGDLGAMGGLRGVITEDERTVSDVPRLPREAGTVRGTFTLPGTGRSKDPVLLVYGDSFVIGLAPFFTKSFQRVVVVLDKQIVGASVGGRAALDLAIATEKPDAVIQVLVERNLAAPPDPEPKPPR